MKSIYKVIVPLVLFLFNNNLFAQQKMKGNLNATTIANTNVKIHSNSNSVFSSANNHSNYAKKDQPKKDEIKMNKGLQKTDKVKNKKSN